ncbi:MAG: PEGA domain-containing protein [Acidobacteria bacterium]|nr:PEGA domain-containing protein [Acidobacteriota bacterium]
MSHRCRLTGLILTLALALALPTVLAAQGRGNRRPPPRPRPTVVLRGQVFVGGYFYDPRFGPYPWWPAAAYPWYAPIYDHRAELRVLVSPREAAVYVDGYYAGIVDDFDGLFQSLPLAPGGHIVVLYLEAYRTASFNLYLRPGSTMKLRHTMEPLPPGRRSMPPNVAPSIPPPPPGSYLPPRTPVPLPLPAPPPAQASAAAAVGLGMLDLRVQPPAADVTIDGAPWMSSDPGHFVVRLPGGRHVVEVFGEGYRRFSTEVEVRDGETTPLNVSLSSER